MNKKGAEMTIGTIVIIVLALIVLVVLVVGFTSGWSNLWGRISAFFGGGSNVDSIVNACSVACVGEAQNDWCTRVRNVNFGKDDSRNAPMTCNQLSAPAIGAGLDPCPAIQCPPA